MKSCSEEYTEDWFVRPRKHTACKDITVIILVVIKKKSQIVCPPNLDSCYEGVWYSGRITLQRLNSVIRWRIVGNFTFRSFYLRLATAGTHWIRKYVACTAGLAFWTEVNPLIQKTNGRNNVFVKVIPLYIISHLEGSTVWKTEPDFGAPQISDLLALAVQL